MVRLDSRPPNIRELQARETRTHGVEGQRLERVAEPPALTYGPRFNEPRFWDLFVFLMLGGRESNRTFLMGALFDGPYRAIAKTGLRPVLTIRPLTP